MSTEDAEEVAMTRTTMRDASTGRTSTGPTAKILAVALIVLGILGMHALGSHGATTAPEGSTHSSAGMSSTHAADRSDPPSELSAGATSASSGHGHRGAMGDMVVLCALMLAAAAGTLLLLLVLARRARRAWITPLLVRLQVLLRIEPTSTGPPPAWRFSVIRC